MPKLLNIDANAKTVKGQAKGYMTAVMYLAPWKASGQNVCPMAELAGCYKGCLNTAGRGGIAKGNAVIATDAGDIPDNSIQRARLRRTELWHEDRHEFKRQLVDEIERFIKKAEREGLIPAVRLNGTSDIQWEREAVHRQGQTYGNIMAAFPDVQFYDYTKIPKRFYQELPSNYHLSLSYSEANARYEAMCREAFAWTNASLVMVVRDQETKNQFTRWADTMGRPFVDGDETDLRFTDPDGAVVVLKAKGAAKQDQSGFVLG